MRLLIANYSALKTRMWNGIKWVEFVYGEKDDIPNTLMGWHKAEWAE